MNTRSIIRWAITFLSAIFLALYILALVFTYHFKEGVRFAVNRYAVSYVESEFEEKIKLQKARDVISNAADIIGQIIPKSSDKMDFVRKRFRKEMDSLMEKGGWKDEDLKELYKTGAEEYEEFNAVDAVTNSDYLANWVRYRYISTKIKLIREVRTNIICNIVLFTFIFVLNFGRGYEKNIIPLVIGIILSAASVYLYFFQQEWIFKLLMKEFSGFGYIAIYGVLLIWVLIPGRKGQSKTAEGVTEPAY